MPLLVKANVQPIVEPGKLIFSTDHLSQHPSTRAI